MTKKNMLLIFVLWLAVMLLIFATPAQSREVGMVQTTGAPTCADAKQDILATSIRLHQLKDEFNAETNESLRFVLKEEAKAVAQLGNKIIMFMRENCRNA